MRRLGHEVEVRVISPERQWASDLPGLALKRIHGMAGSALRLMSALWILRDVERFDLIFMNRDLLPEVHIDWIEPWLTSRNQRLIFDFDDAIYLGHRMKKIRKILPSFAHVTAGNDTLASFSKEVIEPARVSVLPTVVDTDVLVPAINRRPGPFRIGWMGSRWTMMLHLPIIQTVLERLAGEISMEFHVVCDKKPDFRWKNVNMHYKPWSAEREREDLQDFDVGLMPLPDSAFERGKCGCKAIQYMASGIPSLISPVGAASEIVRHQIDGFHCSSEQDWSQNLKELAGSPDKRKRLGRSARERAENCYSLHYAVPRLLEIFEQVCQRCNKGFRVA